MLINEIVTSENLLNHAYFSEGELWKFNGGWGSDLRERGKRSKRPPSHKQENGLTIRQTEIVKYVQENQPCRSVDIIEYLGTNTSGIDSQATTLIKKGLIQKDPSTAMWYDPKNKPAEITKQTLTEEVIFYLKTHENVKAKDLNDITKSAKNILRVLKNQGKVTQSGPRRPYNWIGE